MIYLDANVVIRLVEGDETARSPLELRLSPSLGRVASLATSQLTRLECRSKPLRVREYATLSRYDIFFSGVELTLIDVSSAVIDRATTLRAKYAFKTPDAIHVASAIEIGAAAIITGDRALARCSEISVEVI